MQGDKEKGMPLVGLKKLKKILKACRKEIEAQQQGIKRELLVEQIGDQSSSSVAIVENKCGNKCSGYCPGMNFYMLNLVIAFFSFFFLKKS